MSPKRRSKRISASAEAPLSFNALPNAIKAKIAQFLIPDRFNRLDTLTNICENISNLACTCRKMRDVCRDLWPLMAAQVEPGPGDAPSEWWEGAPPSKRIEKTAFPIDYTYDAPSPLLPEEVKDKVENGTFDGTLVPPRVAAEMMRLNNRYMAKTRACKEYGLTPGELLAVPIMAEAEQAVGWHFRTLPEVARVAQRKHGTIEALEAWLAAAEVKQNGAEAWLRAHTTYDALLEREKFGDYFSNKDKKTARQKALVAWVRDGWGGDVDAAVHSPAVNSAPKEAKRSIMASIRAAWRSKGGGEG